MASSSSALYFLGPRWMSASLMYFLTGSSFSDLEHGQHLAATAFPVPSTS